SPRLRPRRLDLLDPAARDRVRQHLEGWLRERLSALKAPLDEAGLGHAGRALVHALGQGLGDTPRAEVSGVIAALSDADRKALGARGVRFGQRTIYVEALRGGESVRWRAALWSVWHGVRPMPTAPSNGAASVPAPLGPAGY